MNDVSDTGAVGDTSAADSSPSDSGSSDAGTPAANSGEPSAPDSGPSNGHGEDPNSVASDAFGHSPAETGHGLGRPAGEATVPLPGDATVALAGDATLSPAGDPSAALGNDASMPVATDATVALAGDGTAPPGGGDVLSGDAGAPAEEPPDPTGKKRRSRRNSLLELGLIVAVAIGLAYLIQAYVVKPYKIPTGSMEPTLRIGQRVLVDRIGNDFETPHVGEIAVFHPPQGAEQQLCGASPAAGAVCDKPQNKESTVNFIKRVVAGPGDKIFIKEGHVYLNGKLQHEPFTAPCGDASECNYLTPVTIPPGHWFMMGDNRGNSDDSRFWGPVPKSWIIGEAFFTYWPPDRIGTL